MKRLISILLVICLVLVSLPIASFAKDLEGKDCDKNLRKHLKVSLVGHGEYKIHNKSDKDGETEVATLIEGGSVYQLSNGTYLSYIDETTLLRVEKIVLQLIDREAIENTFVEYALDDAVKNDIRKRSDIAIANENLEATVILYTSASHIDIHEVSPMAMQTTYYVHQGRDFKEDLIYYTSVETTWKDIVTGPSTSDIAMSIYDFSMIATGAVSGVIGVAVALFSGGVSALTAFINLVGYHPLGGSFADKVQVNVKYDVYTRFTYVNSAETYLLGAVTQRVYLYYIDTYMYFFTDAGGKSTTTRQNVNKLYQSPNDATARDKALYWFGNPWSEYVNMKVRNTEIMF